MARPGQLVECVATALGVSAATIALYNRILRDGNEREVQPAGRGRGTISARDSATLLIAILGSPSPSESIDIAARYGNMLFRKAESAPKQGRPTHLRALGANHTFREAMTALIEDAVDNGLLNWAAAKGGWPACQIDADRLYIRVSATSNPPAASIKIFPLANAASDTLAGLTLTYGRGLHRDEATGKNRFDPPFRANAGDLAWERSLGTKTLFAVARLFQE